MAIKFTDTQHYADIANAIRAKNGSQTTYTPADMADAITAIPAGGSGKEEKDVNFFDYDGKLVESYTKNEFMALETMPPSPTHDGLTAQGWNWSLVNAQYFVGYAGGDCLDIGQIYTTSDGKTRLYIDLTGPKFSPTMYLYINGTVEIDWGDNSTPDSVTGNNFTTVHPQTHTYAAPGSYVITLTVTGTLKLDGSQLAHSPLLVDTDDVSLSLLYLSTIKKIHVGSNVTFGDYAFAGCSELEIITLPDNASFAKYIFNECFSLRHFNFPIYNHPEASGVGTNAFNNCTSLKLAVWSESFACGSNDYFMSNCSALRRFISTFGIFARSMFNNCYGMEKFVAPSSSSIIINQSAFMNCSSLKVLNLGTGTIRIENNNAFYGCSSLQSISLNIGGSTQQHAFRYAMHLSKVTLGENTTAIAANAFAGCQSLAELHLPRTSDITALSNVSAFSGVPSGFKIYVPSSLLSTYQAATNWSTYSGKIFAEP